MRGIAKKAAQYCLSLGLMAFFLYWAFEDVQAASLWDALRRVSLAWVAAIVLTTVSTLVLRSWRWIVLMRPFTSHVSVWDATLALAICYAGNLVFPRSGEALRALSLSWTRGVRFGSVLASVVVERMIDTVWLILFVGLSILLLRERIIQAFPWLGPVSLVVLALCILGLAFLVAISLYRDRALRIVERLVGTVSERLAAALVRVLGTFVHGLEALHTPSAYLEILASSALLNVGYILIIYEAFTAFGLTESHGLGVTAALVIMALSAVGMTVPTPGGTGSYHLLFGQGLILLFAVAEAPAMACATAVHALANLTYLFLGVPALLLQRRRHRSGQHPPVRESDK